MKKIIVFALIVVISCCTVACSENSHKQQNDIESQIDVAQNIFENYQLSDTIKELYYESFYKFYTADQYVQLIAYADEQLAEPFFAINESLFFAKKDLSTYDKIDITFSMMNSSGKVLTEWGNRWAEYSMENISKTGNFYFVRAKDDYFDMIDETGTIIANVPCGETRYDLGNGHIFYVTRYQSDARLLNEKGETFKLDIPKTHAITFSTSKSCELSSGVYYTALNDGLMSIRATAYYHGPTYTNEHGETYEYDDIFTAAYYFNAKGEMVIDLSEITVNYEVLSLSDFSNGKAEITFRGVDDKYYKATIDKEGNFVDKPVEW